MPAADLRVDIGWGSLGALAWSNPGAPRALCLHGWMDNAASFIPLSTHLKNLDLVALDFAGHGQSDHRAEGAHYFFHDYLYDLDAVLDALGWDTCTLIGHSLGAGVASTFAAAAPERVDALIMVDGIGVISEAPEKLSGRLARSLHSVRRQKKHRRIYASLDDAARQRQANNPMAFESASLLVQRAMYEKPDGYRWGTDPRLMWSSPMLPSEAQAQAMLADIRCPVLVMSTATLEGWTGDYLRQRVAAMADCRHEVMEGGHHVHMDDPVPIATMINEFLEDLNDESND